ncbi:hypothetical protein GH714_041268 [Hevea brasiliensis]|uniref:Pentatricopeptide repeat-containing protein n=1 Tax=Hevea brasiliensis TaxID=3981 RepID=A0A6A6MZC2_HEVBR|nr:hypothetical protein GH714_041268 [Hevea brasiliensis]
MMQEKNEVSWNSIIAAYGSHGHLEESLALFHKMLQDGIQPDNVTFLTILSACGHAGQVDKGIQYFRCMTEEYGIPAQMEHYACMVDLFGRAGRLNEAFETIKSMPFSPDEGAWGTLLGACRLHGNSELAEVASGHLLDLDPENSGGYVLLSNVHANAGQWGNVRKIRSLMKERGVQKVLGTAGLRSKHHMFVVADGSHPQSALIYSLLKQSSFRAEERGLCSSNLHSNASTNFRVVIIGIFLSCFAIVETWRERHILAYEPWHGVFQGSRNIIGELDYKKRELEN